MDIQLATFSVEVVVSQFILQGQMQPRGELFTYLNDRRYLSFPFKDAKMIPMTDGYRIGALKQAGININWPMITYIALRDEGDLERIQFLQSKRPVAFYTDTIAIRGQLHVNLDAHENDLLDETRDFLAVTQAAIYPLRALTNKPTQRVPLIALNRRQILGYHVYEPKVEPK